MVSIFAGSALLSLGADWNALRRIWSPIVRETSEKRHVPGSFLVN
jgi:hypothetical protein